MGYVFLTIGLVLGIAGQMCVKLSKGFKQTFPTIGAFLLFIACIYFISLTTHYFEMGIVFAIWAGLTIASTTLLGIYIFKESMGTLITLVKPYFIKEMLYKLGL